MEPNKIEKFFALTLLRVTIFGISLDLISNILFYPQDTLSFQIDCGVFLICVFSFLIRAKYPKASILTFTSLILLIMFYQALSLPVNTTTSLTVILILGFIFSVTLTGKLLWMMHAIALIIINVIFVFQSLNPSLRLLQETSYIVTMSITYSILYFILTYMAGVLKYRYDKIHEYLRDVNKKLLEKTSEVQSQNEELICMQDDLNAVNKNLEVRINERTAKLKIKTEKLMKYSYTNAHHLRGPVARLLGLVAIKRLEPDSDNTFYFNKIEEQAIEIDTVVRQINIDLEASSTDETLF